MKIHKAVIYILSLIISSLFISRVVLAESISAGSIMQKVEDRDDGDTMTSRIKMQLIDKHGGIRKRDLKVFRKDYGKDSRQLMFFVGPADVRNTGFLSYDYRDSKREDEQWLYLPALRKTNRISASERSNSFMGSDFAYIDLQSRQLEDFNYKLIKEISVKGQKCWLIEELPKNSEIKEETGYLKSLLFVRQDNYFVIRSIHFLNTGGYMKYFEVKKLQKIDNVLIATETTMTKKKGKLTVHSTIIKRLDIKLNKKISDKYFTVRRLEKGL